MRIQKFLTWEQRLTRDYWIIINELKTIWMSPPRCANGHSSEGLSVNSAIPSYCNRTLGACLTAFSSKIDSLWGHFGWEGSVNTCPLFVFSFCHASVLKSYLHAFVRVFESEAAQLWVCPHEGRGRLISSHAVVFLAWLRVAAVLATQDCGAAELHCSERMLALDVPAQSYKRQTCSHRLGCLVKKNIELKRREAPAVILCTCSVMLVQFQSSMFIFLANFSSMPTFQDETKWKVQF